MERLLNSATKKETLAKVMQNLNKTEIVELFENLTNTSILYWGVIDETVISNIKEINIL